MARNVADLKAILEKRDGDKPEFKQAVMEVMDSLEALFEREPKYIPVFERMMEPERVILFRVPWVDDKGVQQVQRGFRVQFSQAIGPYKGGCRFHPSVNLSILKFLGFEQILKNSLTTLPMGGGKGGCDFDPKGKSDGEVMRFCQSFMLELGKYIGQFQDVPAGDIGVGAREIGFMFGQYKRIQGRFEGVLTGKGKLWGGSNIRPEATGYGAVYFAHEMLKFHGTPIKGKKAIVSGAGNVAQFATEKLLDLGAIPVTLSDSAGYILEPEGFSREQLAHVMELKNVQRKRISEYTKFSSTAKYFPGERPWGVKADLAFPCATQNEIDVDDAAKMMANGVMLVSEGANMPSSPAAIELYMKHDILYGPGKAANAGGVAVSGLEMSQNSMRLSWSREEVDAKLKEIMCAIFKNSQETAAKFDQPRNFMMGANIAGFLKVADTMIQQGCV